MTSAHSHPSGKAGFRLRNDGEQHKAVSKNIQPGPGKHRGLRVTLWALLPLLRVTWGWLDSQPLLLIEWKWNGKSQGLSCRNTHGFHSLLPPSHVGSGRCNHWAGPGRCRRDGRGYCHIHWCRCHTLPLRRWRKAAVSQLAVPVALTPVTSLAQQRSRARFKFSTDFPGGASSKEPACQCRRPKRCGFDPWVGKIPWRRVGQPSPVFLPGESHGQKSLVGYSS